MLDRSVLSEAYFSREKVAMHHINSFNNFIESGIQKIINEQVMLETDIDDEDERGKYRVLVKFGEIDIGRPMMKEADGSHEELFPSEARLRNITYSAPITMRMAIIYDYYEMGERELYKEGSVEIGEMPIMVGSNCCNLYGLSDDEKIELGEDPLDPGAYFIINGTERVVVTLEDLAPNKIFVEFNVRYGENIEVSKVFSQRKGYRALAIAERNRKSILEVSFPSISGRLNFITLVRALGLKTDEDIVNAVSDDPEIVKFILENLEESQIETVEGAMEVIGKKVAAGQTGEYQTKRANYVIDRYLLPHLGDDEESRLAKAHFLCGMSEACCELALGKRNEDDKDHYGSKRLKLTGDLMEDLFRVSFSRLIRDIKYQLERSHMRKRELNITTSVRADVLTDRILHPLATGNWVGGRTGVSQLLDRTDYMSTISHLRRVISPLSRSQPHFEARDLHPTQWGRICPSETPEGPNCGLVKNFAQSVELSTGCDIEDVKRVLFELGVNPLGGGFIE